MIKDVKSYNELLKEEARLLAQVENSKSTIIDGVDELLSIKHLFIFLKDKIKEKVKHDFKTESPLKESLINISLDFVYEKLTSLITKEKEKEKEEDDEVSASTIKPMIKAILDSFYIEYKPIATAYISDFIDENIDKLLKK